MPCCCLGCGVVSLFRGLEFVGVALSWSAAGGTLAIFGGRRFFAFGPLRDRAGLSFYIGDALLHLSESQGGLVSAVSAERVNRLVDVILAAQLAEANDQDASRCENVPSSLERKVQGRGAFIRAVQCGQSDGGRLGQIFCSLVAGQDAVSISGLDREGLVFLGVGVLVLDPGVSPGDGGVP